MLHHRFDTVMKENPMGSIVMHTLYKDKCMHAHIMLQPEYLLHACAMLYKYAR